jgi:ABC-2 type transport system permease protein
MSERGPLPVGARAAMVQLGAFVRRDVLIAASNRLRPLTALGGMLFTLSLLYFAARLVAQSAPTVAAGDRHGYFGFVVLGMAAARYFATLSSGLSSRVRYALATCELEEMLLTPASPAVLLIGSTALDVLTTTLWVAALVGASSWLFGLSLVISWPATVATFALSLAAFAPFGLLGSAFVLCFKGGDPLTRLVSAATMLAGGVYFPRALLPGWLQLCGEFLPVTHTAAALRGALLEGQGIRALSPHLFALGVFAGVGLPVAATVLSLVARRAQREGALGFF